MSIPEAMPSEKEEESAANDEGENTENMESETTNDDTTKAAGEEEKEGEEGKKPKIDPKDWPLKDIKEPSDNDVLFGRGGGTNHAKGNKRYRKMVEDRKLEYVNSKRLDKPLVALEIIRLWRAQDPPGRFLKLDSNGTWSDVGDKKAREKTSQALREKAPLIRKQQEEERFGKDGINDSSDEEKEPSTKTTRFADGTTTESKGGVKKAVLARDHSLGREYLHAGETMNLEGFSWRDPVDKSRSSSSSSVTPLAHGGMPPPPPPGQYPLSQTISSSSFGIPSADYRMPSYGPPPPIIGGPPPPGAPFHRVPTEEYDRQGFQNPPVMPGYQGYGPPVRTGSWTHSPAHAMPPLREHSLSQHPLRNASASHPAPLNAFDDRIASGYWGGPPPPSQPPYGGPYREGSGSYPPPPPADYGRGYRPNSGPPPVPPPPLQPPLPNGSHPPYAVDPEIAKTWSGQSDEDISMLYSGAPPRDRHPPTLQHQHPTYAYDQGGQDLAKPHMIKRMTSNQNETVDTKKDLVGPSVKRAALNRDQSAAANRLKAASLPDYYNKDGKFDPVNEINALTDDFEQSTLDGGAPEPSPVDSDDRTTTFDSMAILKRPNAITDDSRVSTADVLALDGLESDPVIKSDNMQGPVPKPSAFSTGHRMTTMEACFADLEEITSKPIALTGMDRVSTSDYLDIGDGPLADFDFDQGVNARAM